VGGIAPAQVTWLAAAHLLLIPTGSSGFAFALNPALWTLFCELWINLAHAVFAPVLTTRRLTICAAAAAGTFAWMALDYDTADLGAGVSTVIPGVLRAAAEFGVGVICFRHASRRRGDGATASAALLLFAGGVMLPAALGRASGALDLAAIATFPFVLRLAASADLRGRTAEVARRLGLLSYPLYAIHYPLLFVAREAIGADASVPVRLVFYLPVTGAILSMALTLSMGGGSAPFPGRSVLPQRTKRPPSPETVRWLRAGC
jgi:peptidoglycan/LPS O-acetylase OafA/YrhL